jgi:hypothetical protein
MRDNDDNTPKDSLSPTEWAGLSQIVGLTSIAAALTDFTIDDAADPHVAKRREQIAAARQWLEALVRQTVTAEGLEAFAEGLPEPRTWAEPRKGGM